MLNTRTSNINESTNQWDNLTVEIEKSILGHNQNLGHGIDLGQKTKPSNNNNSSNNNNNNNSNNTNAGNMESNNEPTNNWDNLTAEIEKSVSSHNQNLGHTGQISKFGRNVASVQETDLDQLPSTNKEDSTETSNINILTNNNNVPHKSNRNSTEDNYNNNTNTNNNNVPPNNNKNTSGDNNNNNTNNNNNVPLNNNRKILEDNNNNDTNNINSNVPPLIPIETSQRTTTITIQTIILILIMYLLITIETS